MATDSTKFRLKYERVNEVLSYCPDSGILTWKNRPRSHFKCDAVHKAWNTRHDGKTAGTKTHGYIIIGIDYAHYRAHRLAWFMHHGEWPRHDIDHKNRNRSDNSANNLIEAPFSTNSRNMPMSCLNTSGVTGVSWIKENKKWRAAINVFGKKISLGCFLNIEDAKDARKNAEKKYNFSPIHGVAV